MSTLSHIAAISQRVGATRSRTTKIRELAEGLRQLHTEELALGVSYLSGEIRQAKLGLGGAQLRQVSETPAAEHSSLTLLELDAMLERFAACSGAGSAARRAAVLQQLFHQATAEEQHYLLRLLSGELRQGALAGLMVDAIAAATEIPVAEIRRASMYADLGALARGARIEGAAGLQQFQLRVLTPVTPMLAQTAGTIVEALQQLGGTCAIEWKVDGARVQVHKSGTQVRVFTRGLNEVTDAVPEVVEAVSALPAAQLVLDGETVALDAAGRPRPFQVTMRRFGRKLDVAQLRSQLSLHVYFFDCLLLDEPLVDQPARLRWAALDRVLPAHLRTPRVIVSDAALAQDFYASALAAGHEGVMAKSLDAPYEAGNRGAGWLKVKRVHTLDLVVLAAEWGHGRRTGTLSNLHLGARDPQGGYVMLGKTFKGLTDELLEWQTTELLAREERRDSWTVYVRPELVVEIAFNDIQASPQYPGGFALRFARVKGYRNDKLAEQADTIGTIRELYARQSGVEE